VSERTQARTASHAIQVTFVACRSRRSVFNLGFDVAQRQATRWCSEPLRVRLSLPFCSKKSARFVKITALRRVDRILSWCVVCHVKDAALAPRDAYTANRLVFLMVRGPLVQCYGKHGVRWGLIIKLLQWTRQSLSPELGLLIYPRLLISSG
jgi:hypothetical protein